jgi:hypothetical protein
MPVCYCAAYKLQVFMAGLRGSNIDDSDFASASSKMTLVEVCEVHRSTQKPS